MNKLFLLSLSFLISLPAFTQSELEHAIEKNLYRLSNTHAYQCKFETFGTSHELTLEWIQGEDLKSTSYAFGLSPWAMASELVVDTNGRSVAGSADHAFFYLANAYVSYQRTSSFSRSFDRLPFFPLQGEHNKTSLRGFFEYRDDLISLHVETWSGDRKSVV